MHSSTPISDDTVFLHPQWARIVSVALAVLAFVILILVSRVNYLLFHGLAELFSVAVAWGVFILAWNAQQYMENDTLLLLGIASLFVGSLDLIHTLAYAGMGVFPGYGSNLPTQLWVAARMMHSATLVVSAALLEDKPSRFARRPWGAAVVVVAGAVLTGLILWTIFDGRFPICYVEGVGLTPFKRLSEVAVSLTFVFAGVIFRRRRALLDPSVLRMLLTSIGVMVVTELMFTMYSGVSGMISVLGHLFKVVAFFALYQAIVRTGLQQPYAFLSRHLRESEARFRGYVDHAPHGIFITDEMGRYVDVNPAASTITGYAKEELLSMGVLDLLPSEARAAGVQRFRHLAEAGEISAETVFRRKDGSIGTLRLDAVKLSPNRRVGFVRDITDRQQAEDILRESESRFRQLYEHLNVGLSQVSLDFRLETANQAYCNMLGYREAELQGMHIRDITHPAVIEENLQQQRLLSEGRIDHYRMEKPFIHKQGHIVHGLLDANLIRDASGAPKYVLASVVDISERKHMEQERERLLTQIREQVQRVEGILNSVPEGVLLVDAGGWVLLANPAVLRDLDMLAGVQVGEQLVRLGDRTFSELLIPPAKGSWHEVRAGERIFEVIARPVLTGPELEQYVLVVSDVTRERQAQDELQHQERLAAIGQLAAGIAHDFNNILAVIVLYTQMDLGTPDLPEQFRGHLATIAEQAGQATDLVQQILDFGRRSVLDPHPLDLDEFLQEQVRLLSRTLPESVRIQCYRSNEAIVVDADPRRLRQVLMNLALNARDAMPEGGTLHLGVERVTFGPGDPVPVSGLGAGAWAKLTVRDTGTGISDSVRPHLFEPFYTTKAPGKGSGLGLPQVYGIVTQHGGHIDVQSQGGEGATFTIYLPALHGVEPGSSPTAPPLQLGAGEMILLVEDSATLREVMVSTLDLLNYRTVAVGNGAEALTLLSRWEDIAADAEGVGAPIALVLSDLVMPEMGGDALVVALREQEWSMPVILMTGHAQTASIAKLRGLGVCAYLRKPLALNELADAVAAALR